MFASVVVDGSGACVPGEDIEQDVDAAFVDRRVDDSVGAGGDAAHVNASPVGSGSRRSVPLNRGASPSAVTSPFKNTKNPMVRVMKNIHNTLETNCAIANKVMLGEHLDEVMKEMLDMAIACGAREGTLEHFMATVLFKNAENSSAFKVFKTNETRLLWLKKHCAMQGLV